jgi:hypothetical protein
MKLLSALIAVFMVSGAMAQDYDGNDVSFAQKKKPTGVQGSENVICDDGYSGGGNVRGAPSWSCKDPKTGRTEKVKCKNPPKQKLPPKMTMAELKKACRS